MSAPVLRRWRPGSLPWWIELLLLANISIRSLIRGYDYLDGDDEGVSVVLGVAEEIMSIQAWAALFIVVGILIAVGAVTRRRIILAASMGLGTVAYASITFAMTVEVAKLDWDALRTPSDTLGTALLCAGLMIAYLIAERVDIAREERRDGG